MAIWRSVRRLIDPKDTRAALAVAGVLLAVETVLCTAIVLKVPYTKIDWDAYMSQVSGFLGGQRAYRQLAGDTGPLVYPAGFLYAFAALQKLTGGDVRLAQWWFQALYLGNQAVVFWIYIRTKTVPPWSLLLLCLSKRVHSLFLLRLFNDCVAVTALHLALLLLQQRKWNVGLTLFSAGVSVKMSVLLFAPSLQLLLLKGCSLPRTVVALACAALLQLAMGAPFLWAHPWEYVSQAFDLGRVFVHFWSVNLKFIPEAVFVSKPFSSLLLLLHLTVLFLFAACKWCCREGGLLSAVGWRGAKHSEKGRGGKREGGGRREKDTPKVLTAEHITTVMWTGNLIGIVFARTLHYQFYTWYFHSVPYLLWRTPFPTLVRVAVWACIEVCWNVYPSTPLSSLVLLACHLTILIGLWTSVPPPAYNEERGFEKALKKEL